QGPLYECDSTRSCTQQQACRDKAGDLAMDDDDIAQFHTSAATLATELTTRRNFREANLDEATIDTYIRAGYLQAHFFKRWAFALVLLWGGLWLFGVIGFTWWATLPVALFAFVVLHGLAWVYGRPVNGGF